MIRQGMRIAVCLLLAMPGLAQESVSTPKLPDAPQPQTQLASAQPPAPWVNTSPQGNYTPLSNRQKLDVFVRRTYAPLTFLETAFDAGIAQAASDHEAYGQGGQGYGKRLGASFADNETGLFFQAYALPTLFHQDPRYFRRPELPGLRRAAYAMSRTVLTRSDSGQTVFNVSYLVGGLISTSIANTYYPFNERGFSDTMVRWGGGILSDSGLLVLHEFWPDIRAKLTGTHTYRRLSATKVGQRLEHRVEQMTRRPEDQKPQDEKPASGTIAK